MVYNVMPIHSLEKMQIKLDQFCQEPDIWSNYQIYQSFVYLNANRDSFIDNWRWIYQSESKHESLITLRQIMLDLSSVFGMKCDSCNSYTTTFKENKGAIE